MGGHLQHLSIHTRGSRPCSSLKSFRHICSAAHFAEASSLQLCDTNASTLPRDATVDLSYSAGSGLFEAMSRRVSTSSEMQRNIFCAFPSVAWLPSPPISAATLAARLVESFRDTNQAWACMRKLGRSAAVPTTTISIISQMSHGLALGEEIGYFVTKKLSMPVAVRMTKNTTKITK